VDFLGQDASKHLPSLGEPIVKALFLAVTLSFSALLHAADLSKPLILVAKPEMRDNVYGSSILVVRPLGDDSHVGFIVNRPTEVTLGELFPGRDQAENIVNPVYSGGPLAAEAVFALVQRPDTPGGMSVQILPGLFAAIDEETVDRIAATQADRARFVTGLVAWRPGELEAEIQEGAWYVLEPDAALALRNPEGLWEELVHRSRGVKLAI
jgi:putative transcriptional regulator